MAVIIGGLTSLVVAGPTAAAATTDSCSYGTGGTDASGLCWLNFAGYDDSTALSSGGQQFSESIPGGYTMTFTVNRVGSTGDPTVAATSTPTWAGTPFGNPAAGGEYAGISGDSALYPQEPFSGDVAGNWTLTLSNLTITDSAGKVMTGWSLDAADAESTNAGEQLQLNTSGGGWQIVNSIPPFGGGDPACPDGLNGTGTSQLTCVGGNGPSGYVGDIVASTSGAPSTVSAAITEPDYATFEGVAFAVSTANITLNKSIPTRALPTDQFTLSTTDDNGTQVGTATTTGTNTTATTGSVTVLPGSPYSMTETGVGTTNLANYAQSWNCSNATSGSTTTLPSGSGLPQTVTPATGDNITCTITNTVVPNPALTITKTLDPSSPDPVNTPGQVLTYDFTVTNTGNVPLTGVAVNDTQTAPATALTSGPTCQSLAAPAGTCSGATTTLAPGQVANFTATYKVTQADINNGSIADSAAATGTPPTGPPVTSPPSPLSVPTTQALTCTTGTIYALSQTSSGTGTSAGWALNAVNTTNGHETTVGKFTAPSGTTLLNGLAIAPGGDTAYAVTQGSTSGGTSSVLALDLLTGKTTVLGTVNEPDDDANVMGGYDPANGVYYFGLTIQGTTSETVALYGFNTKTGTAIAGQVATFTGLPLGENNGDIAFDSTGNAYFVVGSTDGAGLYRVAGPMPTAGVNTSFAATKVTTLPTSAYNGITFGGDGNLYVEQGAAAGGGDETLFEINPDSGAAINSVGITNNGTPDTTNADLGSCTYNSSIQVQKNVVGRNASTDQFTLSVTGNGVTSGNTATTTGTATGLQTANGDGTGAVLAAGPVVAIPDDTYTVSETAAGSTDLADYLSTYSCIDTISGDTLVPTTSGTSGTVTIPSSTAAGSNVVCTFVNTPANPGLTITKTLDPSSPNPVTTPGQILTYDFTVTNTGNVPLTGVTVKDTQGISGEKLTSGPTCQSLTGPTGTCSGATTTLAPSQAATFTATYTVTQADIDNGSVDDSATATGTPPSGPPVTTPPSTVSVPGTPAPGLTETKSLAAGSPNPVTKAGQVLTYDFTVTNTGNVTMTDVGVTDTQGIAGETLTSGPTCQSLSGPTGTCSGSSTTLAPGQVATFTATYTVTQADINSGSVNDSAIATGTPPSGPPVTTPPSTVSVPGTPAPELTETKSLDPSSPNPITKAGQVLTYDFTVTNTGNVTLTDVSVDDTQAAPAGALTSGPTCQSLSGPTGTCSGSSTTLAPGQTATFTATYTVTQADVNSGSVSDSATATGTPPSGPPVTTPPSTVSVPATPAPGLSETKSLAAGSPNPITEAGQVLTYDFTVINTGNVTLTDVSVDDTQAAPAGALTSGPTCQSLSGPTGTCSGKTTTLAPGQTATFTATYTVTQADVNSGSVNDSATATGTPPTGPPVTTPPSTATVPATPAPGLSETKSLAAGSPNPVTKAGQVLTYDFTVTNTGNVTLTDVGVTDTQSVTGETLTSGPTCQSLAGPTGTCSGATTTLAPGQIATFTATYTVTQADLNSGSVNDSATATGTPPTGPPVTTPPSTVSVPGTPAPGLTEVKSLAAGSPNPITKAGQVLTYDFTVTNTGNVTLTDVGVTDTQSVTGETLTSGPTCQSLAGPTATCSGATTTLAPGQIATFTATYTVTQADVNSGSVNDSATATGTPPSGPPVTTPPATVSVPATPAPELTETKSLDPSSPNPITKAGQVLTYDFTVTNTGNVTLGDVSVDDTQTAPAGALTSGPTCQSLSGPAGTCSGTTTTLTPGQTATFTATYTVTQADVNSGSVNDSATATGTPPSGPPVTTPPSTVSVPATPAPGLTETKSLDPSSPNPVTKAGQVLTYDFTVTNTGNVTLTGVGVTDTQTAPAGALTSGPTCQSLSGPAGTCSGATTTLAPGQTALFTAPYTVTQADVNSGSVNDSATATGTPPSGPPVTTPPSTVSVPATPTPGLTETKSLDPSSPDPITKAGQVLTYDFTVTNTGNVTLTGVGVTDTQTAPAGALTSGPTCQSLSGPTGSCTSRATTTLQPGQTATFTATYTVTQADVNSGSVNDSATATGTPPSGPPVTTPPSTVSVPATPTPGLTETKTLDPSSPDPITKAGQVLTYDFTVTNTGNVTLTDVNVADTQAAPAGALTSGPTCQSLSGPTGTCSASSTTLAPGQTATFTATYTVTHADLDSGSVNDSATATGTPPSGPPVTTPPSPVSVPATQSPALTLVKTATADGQPVTNLTVGEQVTYDFLVTNTGNVTLTNLTVADTSFSGTGTLSSITCPVTTLAPGADTTCTATYTVTQADVDAGHITNTAVATGTPPTGPPTSSPPSTVSIPAPANPALTEVKTLDPSSPNPITKVGQVLTYDFTVTNTGNVTLHDVSVTDTQTAPAGALTSGPTCQSLASPAGTCSGSSTTLAPGQVATFTATYTVTQADLDNGSVNDSATATGTPPSGPPVKTPPSKVSVPSTQTPGVTVTKKLDPSSPNPVTKAGQVLTYDFTVTNTGNVTLTKVGVTDTQGIKGETLSSGPTCHSLTNPAGTCSGSSTTLAPGQVATFTATYTVTQADLDAGSVNDSATATGTPPSGPPVTSPPSKVTVPGTQDPGVKVVKSVDPHSTAPDPVTAAGQVITYDFTVTNTGNVTLTNVSVTDTQGLTGEKLTSGPTCQSLTAPAGTCSGETTTLAPGQSALFTGTYTVTQADVTNGSVTDSATATGTPPSGPPTSSPPSKVTVPANNPPITTTTTPPGTTPPVSTPPGTEPTHPAEIITDLGSPTGVTDRRRPGGDRLAWGLASGLIVLAGAGLAELLRRRRRSV